MTLPIIAWNGEILGVATKKSYTLIGPKKDVQQELCLLNGTLYPQILVFRENWVVVSGDSVCTFERLGAVVPGGNFVLPATAKSSPIYAMAIKGRYLLVMRDVGIHVYNLVDCAKIQDIPCEKGVQFRDFALSGNNLIIATDTTLGAKKDMPSNITYLREVSAEEQIKDLLAASKIQEAHRVFSQSNPSTDPDFDAKKEQFNADAAWALLRNLLYSQAAEYFLQINYDPRELLSLLPDILDAKDKEKTASTVTLRSLAEKKLSKPLAPADPAIADGIDVIMFLIEEKRRYLANTYNIETDAGKKVGFVWPTEPVNPEFKGKQCSLEELMKTLDTCMLKLYVENRHIKRLQGFIDATKALKCNFKELESYLKERLDSDKTFTAHICLALLHEKAGNFQGALVIWKQLAQMNRPDIKDLVTKATVNLLVTKVRDKKLILDYSKVILITNSDEGLKIFTENDALSDIISEDDVITYLESLESMRPLLKEKYLEHLTAKPASAERFHTRLALHYVTKIKEAMKKDPKLDLSTDSVCSQYRKTLGQFLKRSRNYNTNMVLDAIKGLGLFDEEILLYSIDKKHNEALASLVEMGKQNVNFSAAEQYCLDQAEPLLALLLEKVLRLYTDTKNSFIVMQSEKSQTPAMKSELEALKRYMNSYEVYCKSFIKKFAGNEKMDAEVVIKILPEDWALKEQREGKEDDSLLEYLILALNDRLGKTINYGIAKNASEAEKLGLQYEGAKLQRAFVAINPKNICKVCMKELGAKSFYVYPNGTVTHMQCAKDLKVCPVTNIQFCKKIYD